jgi:hypothetical protein
MLRLDVPLIYIDSDIYFHQNINDLYMLMGSKSIGLFKHRQFTTERPEGAYNVGVCYFNNDAVGKHILNWWADAVLHKKYPQLATCGDQKYLDAWPKDFGEKVYVLQNKQAAQGPWNTSKFNIKEAVFYHFHQLRIVTDKVAEIGYYPLFQNHINSLYRPYITELMKTKIDLNQLMKDKFILSLYKMMLRKLSNIIRTLLRRDKLNTIWIKKDTIHL